MDAPQPANIGEFVRWEIPIIGVAATVLENGDRILELRQPNGVQDALKVRLGCLAIGAAPRLVARAERLPISIIGHVRGVGAADVVVISPNLASGIIELPQM